MRRRIDVLVVTGLAVAALCGRSAADPIPWEPWVPQPHGPGLELLVDHPPAPFGGPASDLDFVLPPFGQLWQQNASDFVLGEPAAISRVVWWGFYQDDIVPPSEIMRIRFYEPRPSDGLPGDVLFEEMIANPLREMTGGVVFGGFDEYRFEVDLTAPPTLDAGNPIWFEVLQVDDISTLFRWEVGGSDGLGHALRNPFTNGQWQLTNGPSDLSLQLWTIPEPGSLTLCCVGALALLARRRGRR